MLMLIALFFLVLNKDPTYKIAFTLGMVSFIIPILVYKIFNLAKIRRKDLQLKSRVKFQDIFPPQKIIQIRSPH